MTVRQLIDALMNLPPDLPVVFKDPVMMHRDVIGVQRSPGIDSKDLALLIGKKR